MQSVRFSLGSDPELFLKDRDTKQFRSSLSIIQEGKNNPRPLASGGMNAVQSDNVLVEFNTTPAADRETFVKTVGEVLAEVEGIVKAGNCELHLQASTEFPLSELQDPRARRFGCEPDYDAWEVMINTIPADAATKPHRTAGGHLHIGAHPDDAQLSELLANPYGKLRVVRSLDIFVGLTSVFLDKDATAKERRMLYGKAGAHRPKTYGVEYRACSSWWLNSPKHTELVYMLSELALVHCLDETKFEQLVEKMGGKGNIVEVINQYKVEEARQLFELHLRPLMSEEMSSLFNQVDLETYDFRSSWSL